MDGPAIRTEALTHRFGDTVAVQDLSLDVPRGAVYGFLGPNGAGKTTTIRLLLGLLRARAGRVELLGERLGPASRNRLLARVGALVEAPSLYPNLTGRENLELTRRLRGVAPRRVREVLDTVGAGAFADRRARDCSLGTRQRLGLALALLAEPELLILDEPTNGLDPAGIREMRELIRRLPDEHGVTVFLSSHLLSEVEQVATDIGIIRAGRLLFQGPVEMLQAQRRPRVTLSVDRPAEALQLLRAAGWAARARENEAGGIIVDVAASADVARINTMLVLQGIGVAQLAVTQSSLEQIFLHLTAPPRPDRSERSPARDPLTGTP